MEGKFKWLKFQNGSYPSKNENVVHVDSKGEKNQSSIVIRAFHQNKLIPGVLDLGRRAGYISWEDREWPKSRYEVLVTERTEPLHWVPIENASRIYKLAIPGGFDNERHIVYYIGRVRLTNAEGKFCIGRVSRRKCYVAYGGRVLIFQNFDILMRSE